MIGAGTRLGPYEVIAPIGAGGMGEVYRARDTRLAREVAVKVLPEALASDPGRLARFESEARSASALNHPNIVTVYDVGRSGDVSWIAMELVRGRTLRDLLSEGPLPLRRALSLAAQVADGLAAAHAAGLVHRDLKPENLMVAEGGFAKILDFGLAKLVPESVAADSGMLTAAEGKTGSGVVLGTASYMSPEQASGKPLDFRSDHFSFGSILYEMVTGRRAFSRPTAAETLAAIIREEPESAAMPGTAAPLRWILERCLAKEPEERYASTRDLARDLASLRDHASEGISGAVAAPSAPGRMRRIGAPLAGLALLAAVAAFLAGRWSVLRGKERAAGPPVFQQLTFRHGNIFSARFAPDGQTVLYGAAWEGMPVRVFSARSGNTESSPLALPEADIFSISASGELLLSLGHRHREGFASRGTLARAPLAGGAPRELLEDAAGADWAPDGDRLAVTRRVPLGYQLEFPPGRVLYSSRGWISHPRVSPAGDTIAFLDHGGFLGDDRGYVAVIGPDGRKKNLTKEWLSVQGLAWSPSGREVWFTAAGLGGVVRRLYAVTPEGQSRLILQAPGSLTLHDVFRDGRVLVSRDTLRAGILAAGPSDAKERDLSWHDFSTVADLSKDGKTLLFSEQGGASVSSYVVYLRPIDGSPAVRLGDGLALALSPDRKWALSLLFGPRPELLLLPTGAGEARRLSRGAIESFGYNAKFLPSGEGFVFLGRVASGFWRLWLQDVKGGEPRALSPEAVDLAHEFQAVSPDSRTVAAAGADGRLWLYPVGEGTPAPIPESDGRRRPIAWSADGLSLFTFESRGALASVRRTDVRTGRAELWKTLSPADPAGIIQILDVDLDPSGPTYAYTYVRVLSDLYIAEGLK